MKKNKSILVLIVLLLLVGAGVFTYARYITTYTGTGTAQVAKWAVALKQGGTAVAETFTLNFVLDEDENVADGKIAPGRTARANLQLDLTGTEVTADYDIDLSNVSGLPKGMTIAEVKATIGGQASNLAGSGNYYSGQITHDQANKVIDIEVVLEWENSDANNATDTAAGKAASTLSIPTTVTIQQHFAK